jgi:hypothetical protein
VDWPPKVQIVDKPFTCNAAGKVVINDQTYCATKESEGAAGSIYTQYAYAIAWGTQTKIYTFSLKFVQCGNYPDEEKIACEKERSAFNENAFVQYFY